jgi:hypothetical protein
MLCAKHALTLENPLLPLFSGPVFAGRNPSLIIKLKVGGVYNNEARSVMNDVRPVFSNHNGAAVVNNRNVCFSDFADICKYIL